MNNLYYTRRKGNLSGFLDFISNFIEITGNSTADSIILTIIGLIAFLVAFGFVGMIFDALGIYDSDLMSDTHWTVRVIVFLGLSFICIEIAKFIKWLFSFQWWIYLIAGIVLIGIIILVFVIKHKIKKKKSVVSKNEKAEETSETTENAKEEIVTIDKDHCPRCGGLLVKRHGPYGNFYGCENFPINNCRYTRKFK